MAYQSTAYAPRPWTIDNILHLIKYFCTSSRNDGRRVEQTTYELSVNKGLIHGSHDLVHEEELVQKMRTTVCRERFFKKLSDPRADRMLFEKALVETSVNDGIAESLQMGILARSNTDSGTRNKMMATYNEAMAIVRKGGNDIVQLNIQINTIKHNIERDVNTVFETLFASISEGKENFVIGGLTANPTMRYSPTMATQRYSRTSYLSQSSNTSPAQQQSPGTSPALQQDNSKNRAKCKTDDHTESDDKENTQPEALHANHSNANVPTPAPPDLEDFENDEYDAEEILQMIHDTKVQAQREAREKPKKSRWE